MKLILNLDRLNEVCYFSVYFVYVVVPAVGFLLVWPSAFSERHTTYAHTHSHTLIYIYSMATPTPPHSFLSKQLTKHINFVSLLSIPNPAVCV